MANLTDDEIRNIVQELDTADVPKERTAFVTKEGFLRIGGTEEQWQELFEKAEDCDGDS